MKKEKTQNNQFSQIDWVHKLTRVFVQSKSLKNAFPSTLQVLGQATDADSIFLFLLQKKKEKLIDYPENYLRYSFLGESSKVRNLLKKLAQRAINDGEVICSADPQAHHQQLLKKLNSMGLLNIAVFPWGSVESNQGALIFSWREGIDLAKKFPLIKTLTERFFLALKTYEAFVVQNKNQEADLFHRIRKLYFIYDFTYMISKSKNLSKTLQEGLQRIVDLIPAELATIHLWDNKEKKFHCVASYRINHFPQVEGKIVKYLLNKVVTQDDLLIIPNIKNNSSFSQFSHLKSLKTYIGWPLKASGSLVGVFSFFESSQKSISAEDISFLSTIVDYLAIAVENERLYRQAQHATIEKERHRLARELHDGLSQSLYSLQLFTATAQEYLKLNEKEKLKVVLEEIKKIANQCLKEMRLMVYHLRPGPLLGKNLTEVLQQRLEEVEKRAGIRTKLWIAPSFHLPESLVPDLYRIIEEALNNSLRHAGASSVEVILDKKGPNFIVEIKDNGHGFDPLLVKEGGQGLINMRKRAEELGGDLKIISSPGKGTTVRIRLKEKRD